MKLSRLLLLEILFYFLMGSVGLGALSQEGEVLQITEVRAAPLSRGKTSNLILKIRVLDGHHIMSDRPSRPNYIATQVELISSPGSEIVHGKPRYPTPILYRFLGREIRTFLGEFEVVVPLKTSSTAALGQHRIEGKVRYQACTEKRCLFPRETKFETKVDVVQN